MAKRPKIDPVARHDTVPLARRLWTDWLKPHWRMLLLNLAAIIGLSVTTGLYPVAINEAFKLFETKQLDALWAAPIVVIALTGLKAAALYTHQILTNRIVTAIERDMRGALYTRLVESDLARLMRETPAALTARFTTDIGYVRDALTRTITGAVRDLWMVIALVGAMFWLDWELALAAMLIAPVAAWPIAAIGRRLRKVSTSTQEQIGEMSALVTESLAGARLAKTYRLESYLSGRARETFDAVRKLRMKAADQKARLEPILEVLAGFMVAGIVVLIGWRIASGHSTIGELTGFVSALLLAAQPLRGLGNLNAAVQEGLAGAKRVFDVLDEPSRVTERNDAVPLAVTAGEIRFETVTLDYGEGPAVDGLDLVVPGGATVALVGRSGAGKSSLFNLVPRLYDPTAGRVLIDATDIREVTFDSLRRAIAVVSQDVVLFDDTIAANIAMGRPGATPAEIEAAARAAHAHDFITANPDGYATRVGDRGLRLSGGERQRIALARAILRDAPILLLDEATSALDAESERAVQDALARLSQGRTTLVIAHRLATVLDADLIVVMDEGRIIETGRHADLLAKGGLYAQLYRLQFREE